MGIRQDKEEKKQKNDIKKREIQRQRKTFVPLLRCSKNNSSDYKATLTPSLNNSPSSNLCHQAMHP